jgi:hypothetical protein
MIQIRITEISGGTLPISVYLSDIYENNQTLLGTITSAVPPTQTYNSTIPAIFETAPEVMLTLVDGNNCKVFKILNCTFGCAFEITIELASCVVNITVTEVP